MLPDFQILLVVDTEADVDLIERALLDADIRHRLTVIHDGGRALEDLRRLLDPIRPSGRKPDLILLDLDLTDIHSGQILTEIRNDPDLGAIPVVVLNTPRRVEGDFSTRQIGSEIQIRKPAGFPNYRALVSALRAHWHEAALRDRPSDGSGDLFNERSR